MGPRLDQFALDVALGVGTDALAFLGLCLGAFLLVIALLDLFIFQKAPTYGAHPHSRFSRRVHRDRNGGFPTSHQGALVVAVLCTCALVIGYGVGAAAAALWGIS